MPDAVTFFSAEQVDEQRKLAWDAWMGQVSPDTPEGWSKSPADLTRLVAAFPALHLKDGFTLRGYQFRARNDGNGIVWAVPTDAPFPDPDNTPLSRPPEPPDALPSIMEAIEGDGSPWSYLSASIFWREAREFGAVGHGVDWLAHTILGADPWDASTEHNWLGPIEGPAAAPDAWTWVERKPQEWRPTVRIDGDRVTVEFLTFCALGMQRITRFTDRYMPNSYVFAPTSETVAEGPEGFVL